MTSKHRRAQPGEVLECRALRILQNKTVPLYLFTLSASEIELVADVARISRDEAGKLRWKPNVAALRANYDQVRSGLPPEFRYDGPTLFVRGGNSDYVRDADGPLIRQIFPCAEVQTLAGVGHWLHAEAPEQFIQIISNFLCAET